MTDYTAAMTRASGDRPPIVAPRATSGDAGQADEPSATPQPLSHRVIESDAEAAALEVAEDATNAAAVRRLVAETAYADESVLLYQRRIGECYDLQVNYVTRDADGSPSVQFCRVIRDAEVACERERRDYIAAAIRLPDPGDEYGGLSVGSGGSCGPVPEQYRTGSESA